MELRDVLIKILLPAWSDLGSEGGILSYASVTLSYFSLITPVIQYTLANPNKGVPIFRRSVPISEFVRISEATLFLWRFNNTKICDKPILQV